MNQMMETAARLLAYATGQAIPIRQSAALTADPHRVFGIAPIRMVAEQMVYVIAFGDLDGPMQVALTWNPLDRDARFLESFALALDHYLTECVQNQLTPRVWLPHTAALEVIELLGYRYRTNRNASPTLQRMGAQCHLLAEEATFAGQQIVAVASDLLASHVATGQSPSEDRHLGALLAWIIPPVRGIAAEAAARAALEPAAAMLARPADDRVETLRERVRQGRLAEVVARAEVERIVSDEVLREWALLVRARQVFWGLGFAQGAELPRLACESFGRVAWRIDRSIGGPSRPVSLAQRLDAQTYARELAEYAAVADDPIVCAQALRAGTLVRAAIVRREQPRREFRPCILTIETTQEVLRVRQGTALQLRGARVSGRVIAIAEAANARATQLTIEIISGVRSPQLPTAGQQSEWMMPEPANMRWLKRDVYVRMAAAADPRVYGDMLPTNVPLLVEGDVAEIARRLRQ
jgi:hypothetical protein